MEYKPDEIYNLAAQSHVRVSFDTPEETADIVAMGTLRLLEAARNVCPDVKIYQASSSEMFGDNPENPQSETTRLMPASLLPVQRCLLTIYVEKSREKLWHAHF